LKRKTTKKSIWGPISPKWTEEDRNWPSGPNWTKWDWSTLK